MYTNIDRHKLNEILNREDDYLLLDVRTEEEFNEKFIKGAINIPISTLLSNLDDIIDQKEKKVIVYCRSGHRSITACMLLNMEGFENLYNLETGIIGYY